MSILFNEEKVGGEIKFVGGGSTFSNTFDNLVSGKKYLILVTTSASGSTTLSDDSKMFSGITGGKIISEPVSSKYSLRLPSMGSYYYVSPMIVEATSSQITFIPAQGCNPFPTSSMFFEIE